MDRKLFLQSLNQQKQDYTKIRKDRRNTPNEFKWLFEENNTRRILNEKESSDPTFMQQAAAALLPQSWAQATGLFDEPNKADSKEAKAARERMAAQRKAAEEAAAQREAEFVGPPAPEVEEPQGTSTTVAASAPEAAKDEKTGKNLDAFDPKDFEHNLKVYDRAIKRDLERVQKGEMSKEQAASNREQFQSRIQSFVKDEKQREQFAAVEQGIDQFATAASLIPGAGQVVAGVHAASLAARAAMEPDPEKDSSSRRNEYLKGASNAALAAALPSIIGVAGKAVPAAGKAIGAAAGKVADKAPTVAKALEGAAKGIETTAKVGSQVAQSVAGKAGTHALGAAAGGYGAYKGAEAAELGLPATIAAVMAGSILGSRGAKALEKVSPGLLGKQIADPKLPKITVPEIPLPDLSAAAAAVKEPARKAVASALIGTQALTQTLPAASMVPPRAPGIVSTTTAPVAPKTVAPAQPAAPKAPVAPKTVAPAQPAAPKAPVAPKATETAPIKTPAPTETAPVKASIPSATVSSATKETEAIKSTTPAKETEAIKSTTPASAKSTPTLQQAIQQAVQQQAVQQQAVQQQVTGTGDTPEPPQVKPPEPKKAEPTPKTVTPTPVDPDDRRDTEDEDKIVRDPDAAEIRGKKLGEFEAGEAGKYTKSVVGKRGQEGGEDQFAQSPYFRIPTQSAIDYRRSSAAQRQGLPESVEMKRRIETAVSKYLKSKEGMELDKHLKSLKK